MKLTKIELHNFRTIHDSTLIAPGYALLVGGNNVGKSAVVDALRCFYEKDGYKFKAERDFPWIVPSNKESWIDLTFRLEADEYDSLPEYSKGPDSSLRVRKYFVTDLLDKSGAKMQGSVFAYKSDGTLNDEPFHGAKSVQLGKFGKLIYVPAVSTVDEHTKLSGPSALRDLLNDVLEDVASKGKAFGDFSQNFQTFSSALKTDTDVGGRSIQGLEDALNAQIAPWGVKFKFEISQPDAATIIKTLIQQEFLDPHHAEPQGIAQYGSGFQRQFIYSIISVASQYTTVRPAKKKEFSPDYKLLLFEEPEAFLHPPQQDSLARDLQTISNRLDTQVLCSTHSPHFVSKNARDLPGVIIVQKRGGLSHVSQITPTTWATIIATTQGAAQAAPDPNEEAIRYFIWLDPQRAGMFFAKHILLVEGPTEKALIGRLISDGKLKCKEGDITVIDTIGKFNTVRFMALLNALELPYSVIVDDDNNTGVQLQRNQDIRAATQSTTKAIFIPGDLETFLAIPPIAKDKRSEKPQYVMSHFERGLIPPANLSAFCALVDSAT